MRRIIHFFFLFFDSQKNHNISLDIITIILTMMAEAHFSILASLWNSDGQRYV